MHIIRTMALLCCLLSMNTAGAQDITGTWEGDLSNDEFIQVNVIQVRNRLCGYTWDYVYTDHRSYCKAYFTGSYNPKKHEWLMDGESFIENSGSHVLMHIKVTNSAQDGRNFLIGTVTTGSGVETVLGNMIESFFGKQNAMSPSADQIRLRKVSPVPQKILERMKDCNEDQKRNRDTLARPIIKVRPRDSVVRVAPPVIKKPVDPIVKTIPPVTIKPADTVLRPVEHPVVKMNDNTQIPDLMVKRRNNEESRVEVNTKDITLRVYDNGIVDGDSVSIFFNGKLLLSHQLLTEKPIELHIRLDENRTRNELLLFAENLGSIPPNTALVVVTAGDKRYELFSRANLEENAVMVFEYKPK